MAEPEDSQNRPATDGARGSNRADANSARIESEARFVGAGCLLRAIGVVLLFFFPIGTAVGVILLLLGNRFTVKYLCSHCRAQLPGRNVRVCPGCWRKLQ